MVLEGGWEEAVEPVHIKSHQYSVIHAAPPCTLLVWIPSSLNVPPPPPSGVSLAWTRQKPPIFPCFFPTSSLLLLSPSPPLNPPPPTSIWQVCTKESDCQTARRAGSLSATSSRSQTSTWGDGTCGSATGWCGLPVWCKRTTLSVRRSGRRTFTSSCFWTTKEKLDVFSDTSASREEEWKIWRTWRTAIMTAIYAFGATLAEGDSEAQ